MISKAIQLPQIDGHDRLTHSRMACAKTCLRRHYYAYIMGIRRERESTPLRMGSAVHLGLDLLAQHRTIESAVTEATAGYESLPAWATDEEQVNDWYTEREIVAALIDGYAALWADADAEVEIIATEQAFELPLVNPETGRPSTAWKLAGKIDKIVRLADGRIAIREHKTTGESIEPDADYWRRLRIDQQISLYWIAATQLGHDVQTIEYDVIRKPSIRPKLVNGVRETPEQFGERLRGDMRDRPAFYFARQEIPRLHADLDEFSFELWQMQQLLRDCENHGRWPRNTGACLHPYRCEYADLCFNGYDPASGVPAGFVQAETVNPELAL